MLATLGDLHCLLSIPAGTTDVDDQLTQALSAASEAAQKWCKRRLESHDYTWYLSGSGVNSLVLPQRPVSAITTVALDMQGYFGQGPNAFPTNSELTEGSDYVLKRDDPEDGTLSRSGILVRLGGGPTAGPFDWPWSWRSGTLTARADPTWPRGVGNVKVVATAGLTTVPADLTQAVCQLAAWLYRYGEQGGYMVTSESHGDVTNYSYALGKLGQELALGETRQLLSRYRSVVV